MSAKNEALEIETVAVEYEGHSYTFPASLDDADGDVLEAVDDMKLSHALKGLLSSADYAAFKSSKPKVKDYAKFFDLYAKTIGLSSTGE